MRIILPLTLGVGYVIIAVWIIDTSGEWAGGSLELLTFPVGLVFAVIANKFTHLIFGQPPLRMDQIILAEKFAFGIFIVGGAIWYWAMGSVAQRLLHAALKRQPLHEKV